MNPKKSLETEQEEMGLHNHGTLQAKADSKETQHVASSEISKEQKIFECLKCGYKQTFDEAYLDSGKYCLECDKELNIPLEFWDR